jgi:hypothetical protein
VGKKKWILFLSFFGLLSVFLASSYYLGPQKTAQAACGASTSSCKTCHEVKGEDSVSKKGDWHVQHSFGDFCQACHLGVATENDKTKAHAGVIAKPLAQADQSCSSCHPADTATRVAKYGGSATSAAPTGALNAGTPSTNAGSNPGGSGGSTAPAAAATQVPPGANSNFDLIDFNKYLQDKTPWLAWVIGIIDVLVLLVLGILLLRWKKGLWLWRLFRGREKVISLNALPIEAQEVLIRLEKSDLSTILALENILQREDGPQLLEVVSRLPEKALDQLEQIDKK